MYRKEIEKIFNAKLKDMKCNNCNISFLVTKPIKNCPACHSKLI